MWSKVVLYKVEEDTAEMSDIRHEAVMCASDTTLIFVVARRDGLDVLSKNEAMQQYDGYINLDVAPGSKPYDVPFPKQNA